MLDKHAAMSPRTLTQILARLDHIEKILFGDSKKKFAIRKKEEFKGPAGGVRLLISRGFFKSKKFVKEAREALKQNGYNYGVAQIQTAMNRLSKRNGPLVVSKESGNKSYVDRK
jgi:hypothetical protein